MRQIIALDALCVYVTFVDELASLSETTVSMVSTVVRENPALRTYKIIRQLCRWACLRGGHRREIRPHL